MINNFYTLRALVHDWNERLAATHVEDAFSQEPDELTLAFTGGDEDQMVRIGTRPPFQFMFRSDGYSKARRNVATLFDDVFGRRVEGISIADLDRMIFLRLEGGLEFRVPLFGPRANVLLIGDDGKIAAAFQDAADLVGDPAPEPRPAPSPESFEAFQARWRPERKSVAHALASACPLFDRTIAAETAFRVGIVPDAEPDVDEETLNVLFEAADEIRRTLLEPEPRIYWRGEDPAFFSLLQLQHLGDLTEERFDSVDAAARIYVRRWLGRKRFLELYEPIEKALAQAAQHYRTSTERMLEELSSESRAERYERWGHLLMAHAHDVATGSEEVELQDLFETGASVKVPLDPALSAIENAERYYDRARRTRRSREEAEKRLEETEQRARESEELLEALRKVDGLSEIRSFRKERAAELAPYLSDGESDADRVPFRRFDLQGGYQVWVGRNARQNDDLTFHHAQKYDLWMHARGVPGSHTVLRFPNRDAEPDKSVIQQAASIAAYFSKARGSGLVPVMIAERKYVRKPKGAGPGAVAVEREEVVIVEPKLPE